MVTFSCILIFIARLSDKNRDRSKNHMCGICATHTYIIIPFNVSYKILLRMPVVAPSSHYGKTMSINNYWCSTNPVSLAGI